jgi:hypothetical protein
LYDGDTLSPPQPTRSWRRTRPSTTQLRRRPALIGLHWRKLRGEAGGPPPLVVAIVLHADGGGHHRLRIAVRDGYDVLRETALCDTDADTGTDAE